MTRLAICIGAQKAGTTWLFRCFQEHPEVAVSPGKETHYFSDKYDREAVPAYLSEFPTTDRSRIALDISTSYLSCAECPSRIRTHFPDAKIIAILRDPVKRTYSHYLHYRSTNRLAKHESVAEAIERYPELIENSRYETYLAYYRQYFSESQLYIIDYEAMRTNPQQTLDGLCDFLGIARFQPSVLTEQYHSSRARAHPLYRTVISLYHTMRKHRAGRAVLSALRGLGINAVTFDRIMRSTARQNLPLTPKDRRVIEAALRGETSGT